MAMEPFPTGTIVFFGMEFAVDCFEGIRYASDLFHDIQAADHIHIDFIGIADKAQHHAEFALGKMYAYALVFQPVDQHFSPFRGCIRLENCDHFYLPRFEIFSEIKTKTAQNGICAAELRV